MRGTHMKLQLVGGLGLAVLILSLGLVIPEANAAKPNKEWKTQYNNAVKELKQQNWNEYKEQKAEWKQQLLAGDITKKEFKLKVKGLEKQQLLALKALKAEWKQAWNASGGYPGSYNGGNGNNSGHNSVPIAGTFLPFAGAFAGLVYWRARQPRA